MVKRAYKYWPKTERSGRLESAIHYLNEQAGEGLHREEGRSNAGIRPTDGMMEAQPIEVQNYLRELAGETQTIFRMDGAAPVLDRLKAENLENDQTVALWSLLPSDMRSALKAEKLAREEAARVVS